MSSYLAVLFPATFPALVLAHLAALISPGPDFFLIVGHSVRHRFRGGAFICLGIACGNAVYIALAILGWSGLRQEPLLYRGLELAGGLYLAWMGLKLWRSGRRARTEAAPAAGETSGAALSPGSGLAAGLASALLNPKNMIFYLTLMTVIIGPAATLTQQAVCGVWMAGAVLIWDLFVAAALAAPGAQKRLRVRLPLIERLSGLALLALSAALMIGPFISGAF